MSGMCARFLLLDEQWEFFGILTLFRQNVRRGHKESNTADKYKQTGLYLGMCNILRLLRIALQMLPMLCHNSSFRLYRLD